MKFLYRKYPAKRHEVIEVELNAPAKVKFMTAKEFKHYGAGRTHTYFKGKEEDNMIRFALPFDGIWHAVVENGPGTIRATCKLRAPQPGLELQAQASPENMEA
ncbi:MAG: DUF1883 domain-containing protein [Flavobacteriales bacterium]|nr:DUF1883 domain-containing protein [Flavobacteriales bacterium]MBP9079715.1 DUF1883 domain-containing protein [Flavobacteriales bacterium]